MKKKVGTKNKGCVYFAKSSGCMARVTTWVTEEVTAAA
jgi:hypothetical protein